MLLLAARALLGARGVVGTANQEVGKKPLFQYLPGSVGKAGKADTCASSVIAPDHVATAMNEASCLRQIEAKRHGTVHFQGFSGLNCEAIFVQVEQFAEIHDHAGLRAIETGVNRSVEFLTNRAAPLSLGKSGNWIRQSISAPIHSCFHINSGMDGEEDQSRLGMGVGLG